MTDEEIKAIVQKAFDAQYQGKTHRETVQKAASIINDKQSFADTILQGAVKICQDAMVEALKNLK